MHRIEVVIIIMISIYIIAIINYIYPHTYHLIIMKIREVIQEFMPCEVCGNRDVHKFYFHVFVHKGSQPYVKCCECEEEYYSTRARQIITGVEDAFRSRTYETPVISNEYFIHEEFTHPLVKILSGI
ncbi:MAG: hypothetical protein D4R88_02425 [Methanosarcinales archaeon]|nr:MAG: hypothetical protein D4R88_02425 [Methanosarcinales archaeon]